MKRYIVTLTATFEVAAENGAQAWRTASKRLAVTGPGYVAYRPSRHERDLTHVTFKEIGKAVRVCPWSGSF